MLKQATNPFSEKKQEHTGNDSLALSYVPAGYFSPDDAMLYDGFSWTIADFNMNDWERVFTPHSLPPRRSTPSESRHRVCGIYAIHKAMRFQYPDVPMPSVPELLEVYGDPIAHGMTGRNLFDADDLLLDRVLRAATEGSFVLTVVRRVAGAVGPMAVIRARRVGAITDDWQLRVGRNLLVWHIEGRKGTAEEGYVSGHWEAMRRKVRQG